MSGGKNLKYGYFEGTDLHGADISGTHLTNANFSHANLRFANLQNCYIGGTDFTGADLTGANLNWADIGQNYSAIFAPALRLVYEGPSPNKTQVDKNRGAYGAMNENDFNYHLNFGAYGAVNANVFNYNLNFSHSKDPDVLGPDENLTNKVEAPPLIYRELDWTEDNVAAVPFDFWPTSESFRQFLKKNSNSTTSRLFLAKVIREKLM